MSTGAVAGDWVGIRLGLGVGLKLSSEVVGARVGLGVGAEVVGAGVGIDVLGTVVGPEVGSEVDGAGVGPRVGSEAVGLCVGFAVELAVLPIAAANRAAMLNETSLRAAKPTTYSARPLLETTSIWPSADSTPMP